MSKKISFTISDKLYDILKDDVNDYETSISAFLRDILEDKYRDSLLRGSSLPPSLKTWQEYFSDHLKLIILYSILKSEIDFNNNFLQITFKKDKLIKQYDISDDEESIFFSTSAVTNFYNHNQHNFYVLNPTIHVTEDEVTIKISPEYVELIRDFFKTGDFLAAIFR